MATAVADDDVVNPRKSRVDALELSEALEL